MGVGTGKKPCPCPWWLAPSKIRVGPCINADFIIATVILILVKDLMSALVDEWNPSSTATVFRTDEKQEEVTCAMDQVEKMLCDEEQREQAYMKKYGIKVWERKELALKQNCLQEQIGSD